MRQMIADAAASVDEARKQWGWYLVLGIILILVGIYAIGAELIATLASVIAIGAVLLVSGVVQIITAFMARGTGHIILLLLIGILDIVVGWSLFQHPGAGALVITLLLGVLFIFGGIYRLVSALLLQFPQYGWAAFSGIVSIILGILLWAEWPSSALWFIGLAVGISLIFNGIAWSSLALRLKNA
jgi:uncharacterized membrane protein HdeD (DUF308 family)